MSDEREAVDTSPDDEVIEGAADLPDDVRDDDVGETEPSETPIVEDDD